MLVLVWHFGFSFGFVCLGFPDRSCLQLIESPLVNKIPCSAGLWFACCFVCKIFQPWHFPKHLEKGDFSHKTPQVVAEVEQLDRLLHAGLHSHGQGQDYLRAERRALLFLRVARGSCKTEVPVTSSPSPIRDQILHQ